MVDGDDYWIGWRLIPQVDFMLANLEYSFVRLITFKHISAEVCRLSGRRCLLPHT